MNKTIYHGSTHIIRKPELGAGRAYNDFGLGFYCTEDPIRASEWAVSRYKNGFVSAYSIDCSGLRIIDLRSPQYSLMHWISLLFDFREFDASSRLVHDAREYISKEFPMDIQGSDCIIGYPADNSSFTLTADFLNGRISYQALRVALEAEDAGRQFVLKSNRAFERILYTSYAPAHSEAFYSAKLSSEIKRLRAAYERDTSKELFINQMIDEGVKSYDPRLQ